MNIKFLECNEVVGEDVPILRRLVLKYSRVTCHYACNLLSHGSEKNKKTCVDTLFRELEIKQTGRMLTVDESK